MRAHRKTRDHDPNGERARAENARGALERRAVRAVDPSIRRDGITSCQSRSKFAFAARARREERTADGRARARGALMPGPYRSTLFEPQPVPPRPSPPPSLPLLPVIKVTIERNNSNESRNPPPSLAGLPVPSLLSPH